MNLTLQAFQDELSIGLGNRRVAEADEIAWACAWLEACGYPGLAILTEALAEARRNTELTRDALGLDLENVSCAFLAPQLIQEVEASGRVFLRNVRHGLYILPFAVRSNLGIGCPVDVAFALGGERTKNPYGEKLALAQANGLTIDDALWAQVRAVS